MTAASQVPWVLPRTRGTELHACIATAARLFGATIELRHCLSGRPPASSPSYRDVQRLATWAGLAAVPVTHAPPLAPDSAWRDGPVLFVSSSDQPGLILGSHEGKFDIFLPTRERPLHRWTKGCLQAAEPKMFARIQRLRSSIRQRWWTKRYVAWDLQDFEPTATATQASMEALRSRLHGQVMVSCVPARLQAFSVEGLLKAHGSLHAAPVGCFRDVDMVGFQPYAVHRDVARHCERLLARAAAVAAGSTDFVRLAQLVSDFLLVHPFLDGNRRVCCLLISSVCAQWGRVLDLSRCPLPHFYFAVRLASRGYPLSLARLLAQAC